MKVKAIIERGTDGSFSAYMGENDLTFGLIGDGTTAKEAQEDFINSAQEMKEYYSEVGKVFPDVEFEFVFDLQSFLQYYAYAFTLAGLERITGINQKQLGHYISGVRHPSAKTVQKIECKIREFGQEISQVSFVQ